MLKILHVDENLFYRKILKTMADKNEFEYFYVSKPKNAFEIISSNSWIKKWKRF